MDAGVPTELYFHFAADGTLLYVGISFSAFARLAQHKDHSHWFDQIATVRVQRFPTRAAALQAERAAIIELNPACNIKHKGAVVAKEKCRKSEARLAEGSKLVRSVVMKPIYTLQEFSALFGRDGCRFAREQIHMKRLGSITIGRPSGRTEEFVTGWQVLDFIEATKNELVV